MVPRLLKLGTLGSCFSTEPLVPFFFFSLFTYQEKTYQDFIIGKILRDISVCVKILPWQKIDTASVERILRYKVCKKFLGDGGW